VELAPWLPTSSIKRLFDDFTCTSSESTVSVGPGLRGCDLTPGATAASSAATHLYIFDILWFLIGLFKIAL